MSSRVLRRLVLFLPILCGIFIIHPSFLDYLSSLHGRLAGGKNIADRLWLISLWIPLITVLVLGSFLPLSPVRHPQPTTSTTSSFVENNGPLSNAHAGSCVILVGIGISELITQTTKFYVGRLRPNFYGMCGFDTSTLSCTAGHDMIMESRMSFPSGHSSLCFAGSVCLVLFFLGRCGLGRTSCVPIRGGGRVGIVGPMSSRWGRIAFVMSFSPLLLSLWCATSRLVGECILVCRVLM